MSSLSPDIRGRIGAVSPRWVGYAALALAVAALVGTGLGVNRALNAKDGPSDVGELAPVPNTTLAKALPADAAFDEARIRAIAREEAQAALVRTAPKPKAPPKADASDDTADDPDDASSGAKASGLAYPKPSAPPGPRGATAPSGGSTSSASRTTPTSPYAPAATPN